MRISFDDLVTYSDHNVLPMEDESSHSLDLSNVKATSYPLSIQKYKEKHQESLIKIGKKKFPVPDATEDIESDNSSTTELNPELVKLIGDLNLKTKLPIWSPNTLQVDSSNDSQKLLTSNTYTEKSLPDDEKEDFKKMAYTINDSFVNKFKKLALENEKQVKVIRDRKKKEEEERKRIEKEKRKKEEAEERARKAAAMAEKKRLEDEKRKQEEALQEEAQLKEKLEKEKIAKEKEAKRLAAEAKIAQQKEKEKADLEKKKNEELQNKSKTNFGEVEQKFMHYKNKIAEIKSNIVLPVQNGDKEIKNNLSRHKRKINPKFGQLTNSMSQLTQITNDLCFLIDQTKQHELSYLWILNFIAKAMVHQAETESRVKPESSLPLARLALNLLIRYPELKELLMARFVKKCPFIIGYTCNIDTEEGRSKMGWKRKSDSKWEDPTSYDERIGGMATLFSVINRLPLPAEFINTHEHPFPISHSWHLLARIANTQLTLITNTHFVVLGSWWDAAAAQFLQAYGNQGGKLLSVVGDILTQAVIQEKYAGAARLRILLEEWQTTGVKSFPDMVA